MSFQATVLKLMIATPGDVAEERQIVRDESHQWNCIHSDHSKLVLMPVGWETHSTPELGDRPQAIINRQILADCDLLFAAFWTRLGSPTGEYSSGTVEEIKEHEKAGKPVMLYFSTVDVPTKVIEDKKRLKQYQDLLKFKDECYKVGLVETYDSLDQFREKFSRQLAQKINRSYLKEPPPSASNAALPGAPPTLSQEARELLLAAADSREGQIMRLRHSGGLTVQTGNKNFVPDRSARTEARWSGVVDELANHRLIEDPSFGGEVFNVTARGFEVADLLRVAK